MNTIVLSSRRNAHVSAIQPPETFPLLQQLAAHPRLTCFEKQFIERLQNAPHWSERELQVLDWITARRMPMDRHA